MRRSLSIAALAAVFLGGCSGAASMTPQAATAVSARRTVTHARFTIRWTTPSRRARRRPHFVSPSAQSIRIDVAPQGSKNLNHTVTTIVNRPKHSASSSVTLDAPAGKDAFTITLYDRRDAEGATLGGTVLNQTIVAGKSNVVKATLSGYARNIALSSADSRFVLTDGRAADGLPLYDVYGEAPIAIVATPLDADGNAIIGPDAPVVAASTDNAAFVVGSVGGKKNAFTVQAVAAMPKIGEARLIFTTSSADGTSTSAAYALSEISLVYAVGGSGASAAVYGFSALGTQLALPAGAFSGLSLPVGLALDDADSRIYIADAGTNSILAYDLNGNPISGWTPPAVQGLTGIAFSPTNDRIYATSSANGGALLAFDATGTPISLAGEFTGLQGTPTGVAIGYLYGNVAVVQSGTPGGYLNVWSSAGVSTYAKALKDRSGNAVSPAGIGPASGGSAATFQLDNFWIVGQDSGADMLGYMSRASSLLTSFYAQLVGTDGLERPSSVVRNPSTGDVYVVNGTGGLLGFTCGINSCTATGEPSPVVLSVNNEAPVIAPPSGLTNFTGAAFTRY